MDLLNAVVFTFAAVTLFIYGLQSFSRELQSLSDGPLKRVLELATRNRVVASLTGALATAFLQSSSAVSAIAVSLADARILNLRAVMAILIGANVGTASTAFIVSMKVQGLGAYILVFGSVLSLLHIRQSIMGKTIFYFGFILFALDQISLTLKPFYEEPFVVEWLSYADTPIYGILAGTLLTAFFQSSSVITGIVVLLADQGLISLPGAVAVVLGANIGTTSTALVASLRMGLVAKTAALANVLFNFFGVILAYYFIALIAAMSSDLGDGAVGLSVAYSHLLFNFGVAVLFLIFLTPMHNALNYALNRYVSRQTAV